MVSSVAPEALSIVCIVHTRASSGLLCTRTRTRSTTGNHKVSGGGIRTSCNFKDITYLDLVVVKGRTRNDVGLVVRVDDNDLMVIRRLQRRRRYD